ncbi:hypothetical protein D9756_009911 [Leucocoprinus leucothites]|uniref:FAD-binding domain-containing protein n=1 Tax=Leucocoprinus leucothites TaxID=201217 RepID=A0A8H5FSB2_9AGAR|nr:hypothetical protein D9756_009911 [Leucoagaricus leucothites]
MSARDDGSLQGRAEVLGLFLGSCGNTLPALTISFMTSSSDPLRVAVVGGGIAGLAVSAALRQQGHVVEIFEASDTNNEPGFGIAIPPNGIKALEALQGQRGNILPVEWKQVQFESSHRTSDLVYYIDTEQYQAVFVYRGDKPPVSFNMEYYPSAFGQYLAGCSRISLHSELKHLAFSDQHEHPPCIIHLSCFTLSCDPDQGTITLKDGQKLQFDLVIGADGIKSRIRRSINPTLPGPSATGICAFRFTIGKTKLLECLPELEWIKKDELAGPRVLLGGRSRNIFMYAINCPERGEVFSVTVRCKDKRDQTISKWRVDVPRETMLTLFHDFDTKWQKLLNLAPPVISLWQLRALEPIQPWSRGKTCILGDAAHAMFQNLDQGAAQSLEDALLLRTLLPPGTPKSAIPEILKRFENIRQPRVHSIQKLSIKQLLLPVTVKNPNYLRSPELQTPIMGYDVVNELSPCQFSSIPEEIEGRKTVAPASSCDGWAEQNPVLH